MNQNAHRWSRLARLSGVLATCGLTSLACAIDDAHKAKADAMIAKAVEYLRSQQDQTSGGWAHNPAGPNLPAISGLVLTGVLLDPEFDRTDPMVQRGVAYILQFRQPDGGIYDRILPSYNTAICVSAIAHLDDDGDEARKERVEELLPPAVRFLKGLQFHEEAATAGEAGSETARVDRSHPFYGGVGYGNSGRPDNSNLTFFLQALQDAGVPHDDPAVQRAVVFLSRTQMLDETNDMEYADGSSQGGFIYATSPNSEQLGVGESKAGEIAETLDDGSVKSRLRSYGSMTYAGFKSLAYARLAPDDPRVVAAFDWICRNYTLEENPGIGTNGQYYFYLVFGRAMDARGWAADRSYRDDGIPVVTADEDIEERDWANDLIDQLATMQNEDGSFRSVDDRWMENNPVLITAYSLIALRHAARGDTPEQNEAEATPAPPAGAERMGK